MRTRTTLRPTESTGRVSAGIMGASSGTILTTVLSNVMKRRAEGEAAPVAQEEPNRAEGVVRTILGIGPAPATKLLMGESVGPAQSLAERMAKRRGNKLGTAALLG